MLKNIKVILGLGKIGFDSYLKYVRKKHPIKMKDYKFGHDVRYEMPNNLILELSGSKEPIAQKIFSEPNES